MSKAGLYSKIKIKQGSCHGENTAVGRYAFQTLPNQLTTQYLGAKHMVYEPPCHPRIVGLGEGLVPRCSRRVTDGYLTGDRRKCRLGDLPSLQPTASHH